MITICGELKATHVKPKGYVLALADPKANYCVSAVIDPHVDADGFPL